MARASRILSVLVPLLVLVIASWQYRWMSDDGFINLRVVRNIANGHGPVFNAGERVEASTSPMWIWTLWLADLVVPLRLEWIAVFTGITLSVAGLVASCIGALRLHTGHDDPTRWAGPIGAFVLVALAPMWKFASSGLENGLSFAWIGFSMLALASWARDNGRARWWLCALVGLGPLVRPELGLLSLALVAVLLIGDRSCRWTRRVAMVTIACAAPVAYEVFRMGYYASLVPNSALAKEASRPYWSAGWAYLRETVNPYWLWVPLVLIGLFAYVPLIRVQRGSDHARRRLVLIAFPGVGLITALYLVRVGGDFMQARLLLPSLFMICAPVAVIPLRRSTAAALAVVPWAIVALVSLRSGADQPTAFGRESLNAVIVGDFGYNPGSAPRLWFNGQGVYFLQHRLPGRPSAHDPAVSGYGIGVESYALGPDTYVLDLLGLGDAFTSHLRLDRRGTIAHEKPLPFPWIPARLLQPGAPVTLDDFELPDFFLARRIDRPGAESFDRRVADARAALACPGLREFLDHITKPLDAGQFFDNLWSAPANTRLRIAPEPRDARRQFC